MGSRIQTCRSESTNGCVVYRLKHEFKALAAGVSLNRFGDNRRAARHLLYCLIDPDAAACGYRANAAGRKTRS